MTARQQRFVQEYMIDLNATQAAIRAGYTKKNADVAAGQLLVNTGVQEAIKKEKAKLAKRTEVTVDRIIRELAKVAFAPASDSPGAELRHSSKLKALELLGKHLGLFDRPEQEETTIKVVFGEDGFSD